MLRVSHRTIITGGPGSSCITARKFWGQGLASSPWLPCVCLGTASSEISVTSNLTRCPNAVEQALLANLCLAKGPDQILHIHLKAGIKIQLIAFIWWHHLDFNEYRSRRLLYNLNIYLWSNSTLLCQRVLLGSWWTNFLLFEQLQSVWDQAWHEGILSEHTPYTVCKMIEVITIIQSIYTILHKQQLINLRKTPVHKVWTQSNKCENQHM